MKRTLYPKLLGGYLIYGLICFIIISMRELGNTREQNKL